MTAKEGGVGRGDAVAAVLARHRDPHPDQTRPGRLGGWLIRDELLGMITGLRHAIAPLLDNPATPDRTRYLVSPILFPAEKPPLPAESIT